MNKRILLIEDNAVSREFLHEALKPLGVPVDVAANLTAAKALAATYPHTLFLCDVHLPDGGPREVFQHLTQTNSEAAIVAITAELGDEAFQAIADVGYGEVWAKPITMATLQNNVSRLMSIGNSPASNEDAAILWNEEAALRAVGDNQATLMALRKLFLDELEKHVRIIELACRKSDSATLKAECHKLLAGCGFVGADALSDAVKRLLQNPSHFEKQVEVRRQAEKYLAGN